MSYRAYITVTAADDGKPLGATGLVPVVQNLNAHVREANPDAHSYWQFQYDACRVASHLGKPVIRVEVDQAWECRVARKVIDAFLRRTGWQYAWSTTSAFRRAL